MAENNVFLCVLFSTCIGLCFAISGAIPAWYAAKDREVEEYNQTVKKEKKNSMSLLVKRKDTVKENEEDEEGELLLKDKTSPW